MYVDLEQLAKVATQECIRQQATKISDLRSLLNAYEHAMSHAEVGNQITEQTILFLGGLVDPADNTLRGRYRAHPVVFQNSIGTSANWRDIPRLMTTLCENVPHSGDFFDVTKWVKEFLWIHPFADGNGRTAWILYNWLCGTISSPMPLPKFF